MENPASYSRDLDACIRAATSDCDRVVEFGCGYGDRLAVACGSYKIGIDAHLPYLTEAARRHEHYTFIHADVTRFPLAIPKPGIDAVLMIDFLEHLEKPDVQKVMQYARDLAAVRIVAFVPCGHHPQSRDVYGTGGDHWQTHRTEFLFGDMLALGFDTVLWENCHDEPGKDHRMMFGIWEPEV